MNHTSERPRIKIDRTALDRTMDLLAIALILCAFTAIAFSWNRLPARVPIHFTASGEADGWGPRAALLLAPAIGALAVAVLFVTRRYPHALNYPTPITPANAHAQYRLGVRMLTIMGVFVAALIAGVTWLQVRSALRGHGQLEGGAFLLAFVMVTPIVLLVAYVIRARKDS